MYCVFYKTSSNLFKVFDGVKIETVSTTPRDKSTFEMLNKKYEASENGLKKYYTDIQIASNELKKSKELRGFDYITPYKMDDGNYFYKNRYINILNVFKKISPKDWNNHEPIYVLESSYIERCNNGGIQFCEVGEHNSFGYDFSNYYSRLLGDMRFSDLLIPTKQGTESIILELPERFSFGYYHVKITCDDANIKKVFSFSKHNIYTNYSLNFIYELKKRTNLNLNINLELIQDGKPNAYIYKDDDLIKTSSIFNGWFKCMNGLRKTYPQNILVKMLSSSLWGYLSQKNSIFRKGSEIESLDVCITNDAKYKIIDIVTQEDNQYYELLETIKPYKNNIRLKPFITSFGRNKTARVAIRMIDNVIRIHTDDVCFNIPYTFVCENLKPEAKTTGKIQFNNVNNYMPMASMPEQH